jgi:hypothetical protein
VFGLKTSELVAWYAAIVSTIVFLWDIYKWLRTEAKIRVSVTSNMVLAGGGVARTRRSEDSATSQGNLCVEVVNVGGRKTTLTHLYICCYANLWMQIRNKPMWQGVVPDPVTGRLPSELDVGGRWLGLIEQTEELENDAAKHRLCVGINSSTSRKPHLTLVSISRRK